MTTKEEPKQIKCYCGHTTYCDCSPIETTPNNNNMTQQTAVKWLQEHWNLQHTIWGFENGDYTETKIQICYKTNEPCKFDCKGLCRESF